MVVQTPCEGPLAASCGQACQRDGECNAGLYCLTGACRADCAPGATGCPSGQVCTAQGRCVRAAATGGGGAGDGGAGVADGCADIVVQLTRQEVSLMLVIDQSGSMTNTFGNTTRWRAVRDALVHPRTGVVRTLEGEVRFGLAMYTSHQGFQGGACPILRPPLAATLRGYDAIARALNAAEPDGDTPTAESVTAATRLLRTTAPDEQAGIRALVLATDGEPDTCTQPNPSTRDERDAARAQSVAAVRAAFGAGVRTYVVSVGTDVAESHLRDLANAGAGTTTARFYRASNPDALTAAFREIANGTRSCVFRLNGRVDAAQASAGEVRLDGVALGYGGADGWRLRSAQEIELRGAACTRVQTTASVLSARFPCGVVTPG